MGGLVFLATPSPLGGLSLTPDGMMSTVLSVPAPFRMALSNIKHPRRTLAIQLGKNSLGQLIGSMQFGGR